jgi:2',3'-cyclic-nucleotide 2'-phosphodiesterase (5'-nucleotidase family)
VGELDLAHGATWLKQAAQEAHVPLLCANLADATGAHPFPATARVDEGGAHVGLFAVIGAGGPALPDKLVASDPEAAAREAVARLKAEGAEIVVALLHMDDAAARKLLAAVPGIDVALLAHEGRFQPPESVAGTLVAAGGDRGRQVGKLTLFTSTRGAWADASADLALDQYKRIQQMVAAARERKEHAKTDAERASLQAMVGQQEARLPEARAAVSRVPDGRLYRHAWVSLLPEVQDDPDVRDAVAQVVARWGEPGIPPPLQPAPPAAK